MEEIKMDASQFQELGALKSENERLKAKNAKLYKDCVSFAKKIKANEKNELKIQQLESEIESLKSQLEEALASGNQAASAPLDVPAAQTADNAEDAPYAELYAGLTAPIDSGEITFTPEPAEMPMSEKPKNHKTEKKASGLRIFVRTILWIFFIISLLVCIGSGITYLFSTTYEDYAIAGYRFASVTNNAMSPSVDRDSVVLVKYVDSFDGIELESLVLTSKDGRSVGKLTGLNVSEGSTEAAITDEKGTYTISQDQFIGKVQLKIPFIGKIVRYASANQYNYLSIIVSVTLVLLALILLIPSKKTKKPKFGKDYTVEDFTI